MRICSKCFSKFSESRICPQCGTFSQDTDENGMYLPNGTCLADRYEIGGVLGAGGSGVLYTAWDKNLDAVIAVKEFFSKRLMTRVSGSTEVIVSGRNINEVNFRKGRFLEEARGMAKLSSYRMFTHVYEFFEENGTAYIAMELLQGTDLTGLLRNSGKVDYEFSMRVVKEVGEGLKILHSMGIYHKDIAPDNIFICSDKDLSVKILDFGAASFPETNKDIIDIYLKPGYSPLEQYRVEQNIGPWTDVYSLAATLYQLLTGIKPQEATSRLEGDTLVPPSSINNMITAETDAAVMKALALSIEDRFASIDAFIKALFGNTYYGGQDFAKKTEKKVKAKTKTVKTVIGIIVGLFFVGALGITAWMFILNARYNTAAKNVKLGEYDTAYAIYKGLDDYKDSNEKAIETLYAKAKSLEEQEKFAEASEVYKSISGYLNSNVRALYCASEAKYREAIIAFANKNYDVAINLFSSLGLYADSDEYLKMVKYRKANELLANKKYNDAITIFLQIQNYSDTKIKLYEAKYAYANEHKDNANWTTYKYLKELSEEGYSDSESIYDELYSWKANVIVNTNESDLVTNKTSVGKNEAFYIHVFLYGGVPAETVKLKYSYIDTSGYKGEAAWDFEMCNGDNTWFGYPKGISAGTFSYTILNADGTKLASGKVEIK